MGKVPTVITLRQGNCHKGHEGSSHWNRTRLPRTVRSRLFILFSGQEVKAGERAGSSAMEGFLGWRPDQQPGQSPAEDLQQNHHVSGNIHNQHHTAKVFPNVCHKCLTGLTPPQKGSNCGSLMTMEGNLQIYTKTGYYKVWHILLAESHQSSLPMLEKTLPSVFFFCRETWRPLSISTRSVLSWPGRFCLS